MFDATPSARKSLRTVGPSRFSAGLVFVFFLGVLSLCYIAALVTPYALADDYSKLVAVQSGAKWPRDLRIAGGRRYTPSSTTSFSAARQTLGVSDTCG